MKSDLYTKVLLTVIAVCLVLHILKQYEFISSARAESPVAVAPLAPQNNVVDVRIVDGVGYHKSYNAWINYQKN